MPAIESNQVEFRISGIPCILDIEYEPPERGLRTIDGQMEPDLNAELHITEVRDRRGRKAPWLARKLDAMSSREYDELINSLFSELNLPRHPK